MQEVQPLAQNERTATQLIAPSGLALNPELSPDFYQLPGVKGKFSLAHHVPPKLRPDSNIRKHIPLEVMEFSAMSFSSHVWRQANFACIELTKMF